MKTILPIVLLFLIASPPRPEPSIPYFTNVRDVLISQPDRQNFFLVDEELWNHSRSDLGDLRLYDGDSPAQYALSEQTAGMSSEQVEARILNLGRVAGHTEFDVDAQSLSEYDRVHLRLDAHDFLVTASVSGGNEPGKATEVELPPSTLYDFSKEQLGSNSQLKLPASSFRYLHVKLSKGIDPQQVKGATIDNFQEQKAAWTKIGSCGSPQQDLHATVISCSLPAKIPITRISFQVATSQVNFRRSVSVEDEKGQSIARGDVSRVRVSRGGTLITSEELFINVSGVSGQVRINVDNGDNSPLSITAVDALTEERRIYFDPQGKSTLKLYYGDEKLSAPVYDYARFLHVEDSPGQAQLGPASRNPQYTGRPDSRPWSERHTVILWTAMLLAVAALALLALRGLRNGIAS